MRSTKLKDVRSSFFGGPSCVIFNIGYRNRHQTIKYMLLRTAGYFSTTQHVYIDINTEFKPQNGPPECVEMWICVRQIDSLNI